MKPFSIYLHIPFCLHKCPYCDFNTYALNSIPEREYTSALLAELDFRAAESAWQGRPVQTIYFGGGTPSLFGASSIKKILDTIGSIFPVSDSIEVSLEANPGTVHAEFLYALTEAGINRLSLGAQSFDQEVLKSLGRMHSPDQTIEAVQAARSVGLNNINLDIIYGVQHQTLGQLKADLSNLVRLDPTHVSAYGLTIEKGTPFYQNYKKGKLTLPAEEEIIAMLEEINSFLPSCGLKRYEISNFSQRGREAKHNQAYWNGDDYLGLGSGAHSFVGIYENQRKMGAERWSNFALPNKYMSEAASNGSCQAWRDKLEANDLMFEFFFLGLRKIEGISLQEFEAAFGGPMQEYYGTTLEILGDQELIVRQGDRLLLSERGLLLADSVIENFVRSDKILRLPKEPRQKPLAANQ